MQTITKIIRAKDKKKSVEIPQGFLDRDIRVTIETVNETEEKYSIEEKIKELNDLYELARKKNIKIPKDMDIDKMVNEMNDALL
ncbi:MAG: hypothetical protein ABIY50_00175 [Ignavibacteria bacterium]